MVEEARRPIILPITLSSPPQTSGNTIITPQKSHNVREGLKKARGHTSPTNRTVRALFQKVGKALDIKNEENASLRARNAYLSSELKAHKPVTRKKVKINANDRFATIQEIVAAQEAA